MKSVPELRHAATLLVLLLLSLPAIAQADLPNAPEAQWKQVEAISLGTPVIVSSGSSRTTCRFNHASPDTLICMNHAEVDLQRSSIRKVETYNRAASTAVLATAGAGFGIAMVSIVSSAIGGGGWAKGAVFAGGAGMGAIIFFPIGYFTHPIHHTVYSVQ